jgi:hypothetical protein
MMDLLQRTRHVLGLTEGELSDMLGISSAHLRTPKAWPIVTRRRAQQLADLADHVEKTFAPDSIGVWLSEPNRDLHGVVPLELVHAGRIDEVEAALEAFDSGVYV